jgi:ribose/xylose/arabinose/galactoside ABC-type transport system permease subunit
VATRTCRLEGTGDRHGRRLPDDPGRERFIEPAQGGYSPLAALALFALAGAFAFIAAHVSIGLAADGLGLPPAEESPWFLASSRSRLLTQVFVSVATAATGVALAIPQWLRLAGGIALLLGSVAAMSGVLLSSGTHELWPLMLLAGALYLAVATAAGLVPAIVIRQLIDMRRRDLRSQGR